MTGPAGHTQRSHDIDSICIRDTEHTHTLATDRYEWEISVNHETIGMQCHCVFMSADPLTARVPTRGIMVVPGIQLAQRFPNGEKRTVQTSNGSACTARDMDASGR
jgi:hypothetical protein